MDRWRVIRSNNPDELAEEIRRRMQQNYNVFGVDKADFSDPAGPFITPEQLRERIRQQTGRTSSPPPPKERGARYNLEEWDFANETDAEIMEFTPWPKKRNPSP